MPCCCKKIAIRMLGRSWPSSLVTLSKWHLRTRNYKLSTCGKHWITSRPFNYIAKCELKSCCRVLQKTQLPGANKTMVFIVIWSALTNSHWIIDKQRQIISSFKVTNLSMKYIHIFNDFLWIFKLSFYFILSIEWIFIFIQSFNSEL